MSDRPQNWYVEVSDTAGVLLYRMGSYGTRPEAEAAAQRARSGVAAADRRVEILQGWLHSVEEDA